MKYVEVLQLTRTLQVF